MSHTYAVLEISSAAFDEIKSKIKEAGVQEYDHAFHGDLIDMNGIALKAAGDLPLVGGERLEGTLNDFERSCRVLIAEEQRTVCPNNAVISVLCDAVRLSREVQAGPKQNGIALKKDSSCFEREPSRFRCEVCGSQTFTRADGSVSCYQVKDHMT